jgi:hypothetical protein
MEKIEMRFLGALTGYKMGHKTYCRYDRRLGVTGINITITYIIKRHG